MDEVAHHGRSQWLGVAKWSIRLVVLALVAWGIWRTVETGLRDLRTEQAELESELEELEAQLAGLRGSSAPDQALLRRLQARRQALESQRFSLWQIHPGWLALSGLLYLLGNIPSWLFWHRTLQAMGQRPGILQSLRAFFIGHLGKYVPGKAMVVVLRSGLVRGLQVDTTIAATSVFVETLTLMAVGALVAAAILAAVFRDQWQLMLWALLLMVCAGLPTLPPIFRRLVRALKIRHANPRIDAALEGLNYRLMAFGWLTMTIGWILMGLSLSAILRALPGVPPVASELSGMMLTIAAVALAVVLGFLSFIPGGFGVREAVVMALLAEPFGGFVSVIAAVLLRLVWLLSEIATSVILY